MLKKSLKDFYPTPESNGYGIDNAFKRFEILLDLDFHSVLDVGSGPCLLSKWLTNVNKKVLYEAVDIRPDSLELCNCKTYSRIPLENKYELVCLFGTVTFNLEKDVSKNKNILKDLIVDSFSSCSKYLVLTVFRETFFNQAPNPVKNTIVSFSREEILEMFSAFSYKNINIYERDDLDMYEYFVVVEL